MSTKVISETVILCFTKPVSAETVEFELRHRFGEILRWAITDINDNFHTITCTYEKQL